MAYTDFQLPDGSYIQVPKGTPFGEADAWARKNFPDAYKNEAPAPKKGGFLGDTAGALVSGLGNVIQFPGQLAGLTGAVSMDNPLVQAGEGIKQFGQSLKSEKLKEQEQKIQLAIKEAEKLGLTEEVKTALAQYASNPTVTFNMLVEQLPQLLVAFGAGKVGQLGVKALAQEATEKALQRGAVAGASTAGAAMQGSDVGAETYRRVYEAALARGFSEEEARQKALTEAQKAAAKAGAVSGATMALLPGAEKALLTGAGAKGVVRGGLKTGVGEAAQEAAEEGSGAYFANIGEQTVNPDINPYQGVAGRATTGAILGGLMGGVTGGIQGGAEASAEKAQRRQQEVALTQQAREEEARKAQEEEARKNSPEGLLAFAADVDARKKQIADITERIKALKTAPAGTPEAVERTTLEKEKQSLIRESKPIFEEFNKKKNTIAQAREQARLSGLSPEEYLLETTTKAPEVSAGTMMTRAQLREADRKKREQWAAEETVDTPAQQYVKERLEVLQRQQQLGDMGSGPKGEFTENDYAQYLLQSPELAAQVVEENQLIPGLNRKQTNAVYGLVKLQLGAGEDIGKARDKAEREKTRAAVGEADFQRSLREAEEIIGMLQTPAAKPTTATNATPEELAGQDAQLEKQAVARQEIETLKKAYEDALDRYNLARAYAPYTGVDTVALRNKVLEAQTNLDNALGAAGNAFPQIVETVRKKYKSKDKAFLEQQAQDKDLAELGEDQQALLVRGQGEDVVKDPAFRERELRRLDEEIAKQDDIVKQGLRRTLEKDGQLTEYGRKAALAQVTRDELIEQRKKLLADMERAAQAPKETRSFSEEEVNSLIDRALGNVAGEEVTENDETLEQRVERYADIRKSLLAKYASLMVEQAKVRTPERAQEVEQAQAELVAATVAEIKAQRSLMGRPPLTMSDAELGQRIAKFVEKQFTKEGARKAPEEQITAKRSADDKQQQELAERIARLNAEIADLEKRADAGEKFLVPIIRKATSERDKLRQRRDSLRLKLDPYFRRDQEFFSTIDRQINAVKDQLRQITGLDVERQTLRTMGAMSAYAQRNPEVKERVERLLKAYTSLTNRRKLGYGGQAVNRALQDIVDRLTVFSPETRKAKGTGEVRRVSGAEGFTLGQRPIPAREVPTDDRERPYRLEALRPGEGEFKATAEEQALVQRMREQEIIALNDAVEDGRLADPDKADEAIQKLLGLLESPANEADVARAKEMFGEEKPAEQMDLFKEGIDKELTLVGKKEADTQRVTDWAKTRFGKALAGMRGKSSIKDAVARLANKFGKEAETTEYGKAKKRLDQARRNMEKMQQTLQKMTEDVQSVKQAKLSALEAEIAALQRSANKTLSTALAQVRARKEPPTKTPTETSKLIDKLVELKNRLNRPGTVLHNAKETLAASKDLIAQLRERRARLELALNTQNKELRELDQKISDPEKLEQNKKRINDEISYILDSLAFYGKLMVPDLKYVETVQDTTQDARKEIAAINEEIRAVQAEVRALSLGQQPYVRELAGRGANTRGVVGSLYALRAAAKDVVAAEKEAVRLGKSFDPADKPAFAKAMQAVEQANAKFEEAKKNTEAEFANAYNDVELRDRLPKQARIKYDSILEDRAKSKQEYESTQDRLARIQAPPETGVRQADGTVRAGVRRVGGKTEEVLSRQQVREAEERDRAERRRLAAEEVAGKKKRLEAEVTRTSELVRTLEETAEKRNSDEIQAELAEAKRAATAARRALGEFRGTLSRPTYAATERSAMGNWRTGSPESVAATEASEAKRRENKKKLAEKLKKQSAADTESTLDVDTDISDFTPDRDVFFAPDQALPPPTVGQIKAAKAHPVNGKSFSEAAEWLIGKIDNPIKKILAQQIQRYLKNVPGKVEFTEEFVDQGPGTYNEGTQRLTLSPRLIGRDSDLVDVLLHELAHAATVAGLNVNQAVRNQVAALMRRVRAWVNSPAGKKYLQDNPAAFNVEDENGADAIYGLTDVYEFTAEAYSNRAFQQLLRQIPAEQKKTLWNKFTEFVGKLFGANSPKEYTALEEIIDLSEQAMIAGDEAYKQGVDVTSPVYAEDGEELKTSFNAPKIKHANSDIADAADTFLAKDKGKLAAIREEATGLHFRTRFVDNYAALKEAIRQKNPQMAMQVMYDLMTYAQRNHLVQQAVMVGAPVREKFKDGGYKTEAKEGASLKRTVDLLSQVEGYGNPQATAEAFTLLTLGKRAQTRGWDVVFADGKNDSPELLAKKKKAREVADQLARDYDKGTSPFAAAYREYQEYNKNLLRFVNQAGVISDEEFRRLAGEQNYTPLFRADKNGNLVLKLDSGKDITVGRLADEPHLMKLVGDGGQVLDFFTASVRNTSALLDAALHNMASKEAAFALRAAGLASKIGTGAKSPNAIEFRVDGELQRFEIDAEGTGIPTELIVKGFAGVPASLPGFVRLMGVPATVLRRAVTRNPLYMARQLIRDPLSAWLSTGAKFNPITDTLKGVGQALAGTDDKTLERRGITGGVLFSDDLADLDRIQEEMAKAPAWSLGYFMAKLDHAALAADAITRRNVYNGAIAQGASEMQATLAAYESMPFSKRGTSPSMRYLNHMVPFMSAAIQGWDVLYRTLKNDMPLSDRMNVRNALLARGAMIAAMSMAYAMAMQDDEKYQKANTQERLSNWFVHVPGTDQTLKIPVPFEYGILFKMIPEMMVRVGAADKELGPELRAIGGALAGMVPNAMVPQAMLPITEAMLNKSFYTGNDIEGRALQGLDIGQRYDKGTSELSKALGFDVELFGKQFGVSPKMLEYMLGQYTAGIYPAIAALVDNILPAPTASKPDRTLAELPVFRSALLQEDAGGEVNRLYDKIEQFSRYSATMKKLAEVDADKLPAYIEENREGIVKGEIAKNAKKAMDDFAKAENKILNLPESAMSGERKKQLLDNIKRMKSQLAATYSAQL